VLAADVNARRATADAQALQILQTLANRSGPISDALGAAAKRAKSDGKYADAVRDFVAAVRRETESGDLARLADGERRSGEHAGDEGAAGVAVSPTAEAKANEQLAELFQIEAFPGAVLWRKRHQLIF
jgi:Cdc6-like AAA superfamily ATPase